MDHLLMPRRGGGPRFNGNHYPESFVRCVTTLAERGRLRVLWGTPDVVLVGRVK